jgi:hypothetical protein
MWSRVQGLAAALATGAMLAPAAGAEEWEFSGVTRITFDGTSGDVVVQPAEGGSGWIELVADVSPEGAFEPKVEQRDSRLHVAERWRGGSSSGRVTWTIHLPSADEEILLRVETASGSLDCRDVAARLDVGTASGEVRLARVVLAGGSDVSTASGDCRVEDMTIGDGTRLSTASGDVSLSDVTIEEGSEISTASGNIECVGCRGHLNLSVASGDVEVRDSEILGESDFSSASGDVAVHLDRLPEQGLRASSASGDVLLDVRDFGENFTLLMIKREDRGSIVCPFDFTSESTFRDHTNYEEKVVRRGSGEPEITLKTASGRLVVRSD